MARQALTVIVPTHNERQHIHAVLASVRFADEVLVVDSYSDDGTAEQAEALADRVIQREYEYSASQKNWAIPQAKHEWILLVDADERVGPELQAEIKRVLSQDLIPEHSFWIKRKNFFLGKHIRYSGWQNDRVIRLFRRDCRYADKRVHAEIENGQPIGTLEAALDHYTASSLRAYLPKWDRYSTWKAEMAFERGVRPNMTHFIAEPGWRFFRHLFFQRGILDGPHGLVIAALESVSVFMRYIKLWGMWQEKEAKSNTIPPAKTGSDNSDGKV